MRRGRLKDVVDAYRWLWRAQRRWHPGPWLLAVIHFVGRVIADIVRYTLGKRRGFPMIAPSNAYIGASVLGMRVAVVGLLMASVLAITLQRLAEDLGEDGPGATWSPAEGGFVVAFPVGWRPSSPSELSNLSTSGLSAAAGSSHGRPTGWIFRRRHLSAQVFELGELAAGATTFQAALSANSWIESPHYSLGKPTGVASGAYLTAYRFERSDNPVTVVQIVLRGRNSHGFLIQATGDRDDEALLLGEAQQIADSIRQEGRILGDKEIFLHEYLDIPREAAETTRHTVATVADQFVSDTRLVVSAVLDEAATIEECRAGAVPLWLEVLGPFIVQRHSRRLWAHELRVSCPASSVAVVYDLRGHDFFLRQYDADGTLVYEKDMTKVVYLPHWGGNSIS